MSSPNAVKILVDESPQQSKRTNGIDNKSLVKPSFNIVKLQNATEIRNQGSPSLMFHRR